MPFWGSSLAASPYLTCGNVLIILYIVLDKCVIKRNVCRQWFEKNNAAEIMKCFTIAAWFEALSWVLLSGSSFVFMGGDLYHANLLSNTAWEINRLKAKYKAGK